MSAETTTSLGGYMNATIPQIPQFNAKYFDGSTNEQLGFEGEVDHTSKALQARYAYVQTLASELERDLIDPETPTHERTISSLILQFLSGCEISKDQESLVLYPLLYLVLEQHLMAQNYSIEIITAITEFIAKTVDPAALGGACAGMSDLDIFFADTAGMELTAGIFTVACKTIDALNEYRERAWLPHHSASSATLQ